MHLYDGMIFDWSDIDTVLLDMDGTLLDRHFDDYFWLEYVPRQWAARNSTTLEYSKKHLYAMFRSQENTLNWTDLDYWTDRLRLDIPVLKKEVDHLIAVHPFVIDFLLFLQRHNKYVWLVTNAHSKTLDLKMRKTSIGCYFNGIISAHTVGVPKEDPTFWHSLQRYVSYAPERTMLGEDSETNLGTAQQYGIKFLIHVGRHSSAAPPVSSDRFTTVQYFNQLIPHGSSTTVHIR